MKKDTDGNRTPFYQKKWFWAIIILFTVFAIAAPFVLNLLYMAGRDLKEPNTAFDASDLLSLYGNVLAFVGTIVLGIVAIYQTHKAHEMSADAHNISVRLMDLEELNTETLVAPFILLTNWCAYEKTAREVILNPDCISVGIGKGVLTDLSEEILCLELHFTNTSDAMVTFEYNSIEVLNNVASKPNAKTEEWLGSYANHQKVIQSIAPYQTERLLLYAPKNGFPEFAGKRLHFKIILQNKFGKKYAEYFDMIGTIQDKSKSNLQGTTPSWFFSAMVQNYKITKFYHDKNKELQEIEILNNYSRGE